MSPEPTLTPGARVHFVGIGGIGMMALAQYLLTRGYYVSGSDRADSPGLERLRSAGAAVFTGHDPANVDLADLVVVTAAAAEDNPEVQEADRRGIPVVKRAALLGRIVNQGRSIAVAGTHGKSTVTALIAHLLREAQVQATLLGGAHIRHASGGLEGPGWGNSDDLFVVEADEYDRSFHRLRPTVAVITGIEFDHPDCYADLDDMIAAYMQFAAGVSEGLIVNRDGSAVALSPLNGAAVQSYGLDGSEPWTAEIEMSGPAGSTFRLVYPMGHVDGASIVLPGRHNVANAVAAVAGAAAISGLEPALLVPHLATFRGAARRLEWRGEVDGMVVVDDYAHHPTEIGAAIAALRSDQTRLRVVFQPHTYSRTAALMSEFVQALGEADEVVLLDVYAAREEPIEGADSERLAALLRASGVDALWYRDRLDALRYLVASAREGDVLVTMGAGDVTELAPQILEGLRRRASGAAATVRPALDAQALSRLQEDLVRKGLTRVRLGEPLSRHTSWRIGGPADLFAVAETSESLQAAFGAAHDHHLPCLVLGGGSNVLVSDEGIEGLVVLNRVRSMSIHPERRPPEVEAGSGVFFAKLAAFTAREGWAGLEWGVAIPGTVGAGVVNNAGAHHGDVARTLVAAEVVDARGTTRRLDAHELGFQYRGSALKRTDGLPITSTDQVVLRAWFTLEPDPEGRSPALIDELMSHRISTQPITEPSGGSTFKNPAGRSAGALIEEAGLKGLQVGRAMVSPKHANFIVNLGGASAKDVVELIRSVIQAVHGRSGITLEPEIQVAGRWADAQPLEGRSLVGGAA